MKKSLFLIGVVLFLFMGCEPKPSLSKLTQHLVVSTNYDNANGFSKYQYSSYYLPLDTLSYFNNQDKVAADTLQCLNCSGNNSQLGSYAQAITTQVKSKLDSLGFSQISSIKQNPDIKVYVFIIENVNISQSLAYNPYGYGYGGYGGYGYGGYGGYGYGGYYPTVSVSDQADLYIEIFDLKHPYNGKPNPIWLCDIGDLVSSPNVYSLTIPAINQAFKQSTYIKK